MSATSLFTQYASEVAKKVVGGELRRFAEEHPIGRRLVDHLRDGKTPLEAAVEVTCEVAAARREQG